VNAKAELFVDSRCELGEGPFWHPLLKRLFWFDILNKTLLSADTSGHIVDRFTFKDFVSAAGVIDDDRLLVAQAGALLEFSLSTDTSKVVVALEPDRPGNRTNDGRVDRTGGLWIGTMSRRGGQDKGAGALYRYRAGELTTILTEQTIPNSTCFSPAGDVAYFADTMRPLIRKVACDPATGLPVGEWSDFASTEGRGGPDGAVTDSEGYVWSARWGAGCVVRHAPDGSVDRIVDLPVSRITCPAFGGDDLKTLYITSAREHMTPEQLEKEPHAGSVFSIRVDVPGLPETLVKL
jgi:sugar lactone lactonase YvrE